MGISTRRNDGMVQARWKDMFFDSPKVIKAISEKERIELGKFGAYTRADAKQSIKKRVSASKPGNPPHSHVGTLKRGIRFGIDVNRHSVVIGAVKYPMPGNVPETLEKGGRVSKHKNPRRKVRKVGSAGIIALGRRSGSSTKKVRNKTGKLQWATFARLDTEEQVRRSMKLEEEVWGPLYLSGKIKPRPYMNPAFLKTLAAHPPSFR